MAKKKTAKKPGTKKSGDKSQSQTESENDTNNGSEEEMETDDNVDGSGISSAGSPAASYPSPSTKSPTMSRHQTSYVPSPASTSDYSNYSGKNQSLLRNTSSTGSDLENLASPVSESTERSFESPLHQTRQATAMQKSSFSLWSNPPKYESSQSAGNESFDSSPLRSNPKYVKVDKVKDVKVDKDVGQNNTTMPFNNWYIVVIALVALFVAVIISNKTETVASYNQFDKFVQNIDNFKLLFPAQENRFWRTVKASGKHVLNVTSPDYPAILLFVTKSKPANDDQFDVGSCLARKISAEFNSANMVRTSGSPIVDVGKLTTGSPQKQKMEFDDQLRRFLESNYKSVIVEHLELLTPAAALLLHGYCDNDNAPYKDVMIILVLHVENDNINPREAEALLKQSWERELETDKVDALMSRVANNIVIVHPESIATSSQCDEI